MKNIAIFSTKLDAETKEVMAWLDYLGDVKIKRFDGISGNSEISAKIGNEQRFNLGGIPVENWDAIWFRKYPNFSLSTSDNQSFKTKISSQLTKEAHALWGYSNQFFLKEKGNTLGGLNPVDNDKLENLNFALQAGLTVPETLVTTSKADLISFFQKSKSGVVTKSIGNSVFLNINKTSYATFTEEISASTIDQLGENFHPSLFQEKIEKKYEVRVFFLRGKIFSSAIFSQGQIETQTDFRKYSDKRPNRIVPIQLSDELSARINEFMKSINLDLGSIDLIVGKDSKFYFLEVNPFGQFKKFSESCNYYLEREVAKELLDYGRKG